LACRERAARQCRPSPTAGLVPPSRRPSIDLRPGADIGHHARDGAGQEYHQEYCWQNVIYLFDTGFRLTAGSATYGVTLSGKY
jgi:hypothetical protein